ncbi:hypothetical protein [Kitasatospora sp. NPDC005748]|uniref:hypothetical protein n=1 Tax=Kitasatospora sp. NPDC005748 TaxID=3157063 RepID=UPI0033EEEB05
MNHATTGHTAPRAIRLLIGLYPAPYRGAHGDDIHATFTEATQDRTRGALLREYRDLATHALRLRLRIGPTDPAGRVLAQAAPVALALAAGCALYLLLPDLAYRTQNPQPSPGPRHAVAITVLQLACAAPWLLALGLAVTGRWRAARVTGVAAVLLGGGVQALIGLDRYSAGQPAALALIGALVLLAPAALVDVTRRGRWEMAALALAVALPGIAADLYLAQYLPLPVLAVLPIWLGILTAPVLLDRLAGRRRDPLRAAGVVLGTLPWLMPMTTAAAFDLPRLHLLLEYAGACAAPLGVALAVAGALQLARRVRADDRSGPA